MLTAGGRVDIQVLDRASSQIRLRRMMENVEVLSVNPGKSDVTLLVNPADADRLSLADAAMNIRIVLRNPADKATSGPQVIESAAISSSQAKTGPQSPQAELLAAR